MVHPAAYAIALGVGVGVLLLSLLFERRNPEEPHQSRPRNRNPFEDFVYRPDPAEKNNCSICLESLEKATVHQLQCGHQYHRKCIEDSVKNNYTVCSQCRKPFKLE